MNEYDEIFDVVDSDDNVVGKAAKEDIKEDEIIKKELI